MRFTHVKVCFCVFVCSMSVRRVLSLFVMLFVTDALSTEAEQREALKHIDTHNMMDQVSVRRFLNRNMCLSPLKECILCVYVQNEITTTRNFSQTSQESPSPGHTHTIIIHYIF